MKEFTAKKLGEVVAFSNVGLELAERSGDAFMAAMGEKMAVQFREELKGFADVATQHGNDLTTTKAEKTTVKLRNMMEAYIGDEWGNPVEILEWLSFFAGSGAAHWALVSGAANTAELVELEELATEAKDRYHAYLHHIIEALAETGKERGAD